MRLRWLALLALAACGKRGSLYDETLTPLPLVSTQSTLVQVVPQTRRAVVLTPKELTPGALTLSRGARLAAAVPGTDTVAVVGGTAKAATLDLVDVSGGAVVTLALPGAYDAITFSPEARFAVLTYLPSAGTGSLVARNLNEVALVDLLDRSATRLSLDTESLAPRAVTFGPADTNRRLVAVSLERGVAIFDALHPAVAPRRISLRTQGSASENQVLEAVFSSDAHWLFLRASALDDVIVVELGPEVGTPVTASLNFVAGGRGLADIEQAPAGFPDAVLAVYGASREALLLDARGIQDNVRRLPLPDASTHLQRLSGTHVLFWSEAGRSVTAWDVSDGRSGTVALDGSMAAPMLLPTLDKALLPLQDTAAGSTLTTLAITGETNRLRLHLQGIQLSSPFEHGVLDPTGQRLYFSVASRPTLVVMDVGTLALDEVQLDAQIDALFFVPQGGWLFAQHPGNPYGDVTLLQADQPSRATAVRYTDFAFTDDFDRPGDAP